MTSNAIVNTPFEVIQELVVGPKHILVYESEKHPTSDNMQCFDAKGALLWTAEDRPIGGRPNPYMNIYPFDDQKIRASCYISRADILVSLETGKFLGLFPYPKRPE